MATSTELLRAAEHMQQIAADLYVRGMYAAPRMINDVVSIMRDEAKLLQTIEAQQPRRSWPEGWPPFAVLRRAYMQLGERPMSSTLTMERHLGVAGRIGANSIRKAWRANLDAMSAK